MERWKMYILLSVFTTIGSYVPVFFGSSEFSGWTVIGGMVGGFIGVYIVYQSR